MSSTITLTVEGFEIELDTYTCDRCRCRGVVVDCDYQRTIDRTVEVVTPSDDPSEPDHVAEESVEVELPDDLEPLMAGATGGHALDRVYCESCADEVGEEIEALEAAEASLKRVADAADLGDATAEQMRDALADLDDAHPEGFAAAASRITALLPRDLRASGSDPETIAETQVVAVLPDGSEVIWCGAREGRDAWGVRAPEEARSALGRQRCAESRATAAEAAADPE